MVFARETEFSFTEYCRLEREDPFELVNGVLKPMNPPKTQHFFIAKFLERMIEAEIARGGESWVCLQGAGVRTGLRKVRLPDLLVMERQAVLELWEESAIFEVAPRLVVEIVSPSSQTDDYRYKRSEYGAIEIPEYWIVDPLVGQVWVLRLEEGFYEERKYSGEDLIESLVFPQWSVTAGRVLGAGQS